MPNCNNVMDHTLTLIGNAGQQELQDLMDAIQDRYAQLFTDWDILYMALPRKDSAQRECLIHQIMEKISLV